MQLALVKSGRRLPLGDIPPGDDGVAATIAAMQAVIDDAAADAELPRASDARGVYEWCARNITFRRDPPGEETIVHPADLIAAGAGDCDDLACLGCAMLARIGYPPCLITVGRRAAGRFEHVFFGHFNPQPPQGGPAPVVPMDPQEKVPFGSWPEKARRVRVWRVTVTSRAHRG